MLTIFLIIALGIIFIASFRYPALSLFFFLTTAVMKATLMMKFGIFRVVDYTLLCALFTLLAMVYSFIRGGGNLRNIISAPTVLYLILSMILLFGVIYTSAPNYGTVKSTRFATLGFIAFMAPIMFVRKPEDFKIIIWMLVAVGLILAITVIVAPETSVLREDVSMRGSFFEASPLETANKVAVVSIIAFTFAIMYHTRFGLRIVSFLLLPILLLAIIRTASRGPFLGLIVAWLLALFICRRGVSKNWTRVIVTLLVLTLFAMLIKLPERETSRITNMFESTYAAEKAVESRTTLFSFVLQRASKRPIFGHGTGAFALDRVGQDVRAYPHNIILEVLYEQGLVGVTCISVFLCLILWRWRVTARLVREYNLGIQMFQIVHINGLTFFYSLLQAMKSSDIDGNRFLFFCAGFVVATFNVTREMARDISSSYEFGSAEEPTEFLAGEYVTEF